jgi:hypothetical protein
MNKDNELTMLIKDAMDETYKKDIIQKDNIKKDNIIIVYDNFFHSKNFIIEYLNHKKEKLYNKLSRRDYDDYREVLNDIYNFYKFNLDDINKICYDDYFNYKFNEIKKNIRYEYDNIKLNM